ncbi:hypothetical protein LWI29_018039 [Acer saccharum]|uniref:Uncharacterized protein n=1 Tax=Acer saccharum TaxID=4024 RepID=A0AA39RMG7_ACESA|nr:hypothetical protein LWI29_018039 [Acer saccharum]
MISCRIPENGRIIRSVLGFNAEISVSKDGNLYPETQRLQRIAMVKSIEKNIVGKVSVEWLAGEKTKVVGIFPPKKRGWTGYVEKDTAGSSSDGAENTTAVVAGIYFPGTVRLYVHNDAVAALACGTIGKLHGCVLIDGTGTIAYGFTEDGGDARAAGLLKDLGSSPFGANVLLHACAHNPTARMAVDAAQMETKQRTQKKLKVVGQKFNAPLQSWHQCLQQLYTHLGEDGEHTS